MCAQMIFTDGLSLEDFEEERSYMAHLWPMESGLPYEILIDYNGKNRARPNNSPRIMLCLDRTRFDFVPISIDKEKPVALIECEIPEFEMIADWIKENFDILMEHWNGEISDCDALVALTKKRRLIVPAISKRKTLQEMANVLKGDTGLPYDIWLDSEGYLRQLQHNKPRLKVRVDGDWIPVSIDKFQPEILVDSRIPKFRKIADWIRAKYPILMLHWNGDIKDKVATQLLKMK